MPYITVHLDVDSLHLNKVLTLHSYIESLKLEVEYTIFTSGDIGIMSTNILECLVYTCSPIPRVYTFIPTDLQVSKLLPMLDADIIEALVFEELDR